MTTGFNNFPVLSEKFDIAISQVIRKAAFDIQAKAQGSAPVDTGFLKNSIYTVTSDSSNYGNAGSLPKGASLLPEIPGPPDAHTAYVAVGANYGIYVEMGTRHMPPKPYLDPAVETVRPSFESAMSAIDKAMQ